MQTPPSVTVYENRLDPRRTLAARGAIRRDDPDETPDIELVELVERFIQESEMSDYRSKAVRMWEICDRFVDGDQWDWYDDFGPAVEDLAPWQAKLTINKIHPMVEKMVSLILESLPDWEYISRDSASTLISDALDMYVSHEWERNNWLSVISMGAKQMMSHSTTFFKVFWDIHGDGGRGAVKIEPLSNYDLFIAPGSMIRDGKLRAKYIVHRMEMTREQILSIYGRDPGGEIVGYTQPESYKGRPKSNFQRYVDDLNTGKSTRGSGGLGGTNMHAQHPGRDFRNDTFDVYECLYFDDSRVEMAEIDNDEGEIPPLAYPNGRVVTISNGTLLYDKPNVLGYNFYVGLSMSPDLERIYPPSIVWKCISPQMELNRRRSQIADHATLTANPVLVVTQLSSVDQESIVGEPGEVIVSFDTESKDGGVWWLQPPGLTKEVVESAVFSEIAIDEISGKAEIQRGQAPNQLESGVALDIQQKSTMTVPTMHTTNFDQGVKEILRCVGSCMLDFVSDERKFMFMDTRQLKEEFGSFNPVDLLLPSRDDAAAEVQEKINVLQEQLADGQLMLPPEEFAILEQYIMQQIQDYQNEIRAIYEMPAHDLISIDVALQTGTRGMTQQAITQMADEAFRDGSITVESKMELSKFPNWMRHVRLKQEETMANLEFEQEQMEQQLAIEREIDEDEHEQALEIEHVKGKYRIAEAEIRAKAQREVARKRAANGAK